MAWKSLASVEDVRQAGNYSDRIKDGSITFYLEISSYVLSAMIGSTNYGLAKSESLDVPFNDMLKKAEACMAVSFSLPAVGVKTSEMGIIKQMAMARGGEFQNISFAKEIMELASAFMSMANFLIPDDLIQDADAYGLVWHHIVQTLFPSLDEFPTRATIRSAEEEIIQEERGSEAYVEDGVD
jgi:hypothetical protein